MVVCKHCKGSKFGAVIHKGVVQNVIMSNGKVVKKVAEEPFESKIEYKFCAGCNKEITNDDVMELESCSVCGKNDVLIDGKCQECNDLASKIASMSQDELLKMLVAKDSKQQKPNKRSSKKTDNGKVDNEVTKKQEEVTNESEKENQVKANTVESDKSDDISDDNVNQTPLEFNYDDIDSALNVPLSETNTSVSSDDVSNIDDLINSVNDIVVNTNAFLEEDVETKI